MNTLEKAFLVGDAVVIGAGALWAADRAAGVARSPAVTQRQVWFQRVLGFFLCFVVGFATVAALVLTGYGPAPGMFGPEDLGSPAATPGSQSSPVRTPSEPAPEWVGPAGPAEKEPGPGTFGLQGTRP
jgi:hypothetical protein